MVSKERISLMPLLNCKASKKTWKITDFADKMNPFANQDLLGVFQALTTKKGRTKMELFVAICWANWHSRSLFIFKGKNEDSQVSLAKIKAIMEAYKKIKPLPLPSPQSQTSLAEHTWKPLSAGCLKINVDATTKRQNKVASLGVVIRDSKKKKL